MEKVHESSSVCVLDDDEVVCVARVPTKRIMTASISVGTRFPAYATSRGRVLLAAQGDGWLNGYFGSVKLRMLTPHTIAEPAALRAELQRIHEQGWALVDQELEEGLRSIAAPIHGSDGRVIAAMNVSTHTSRCSHDEIADAFLAPLLHAARLIEDDLCRSGTLLTAHHP